MKRLMVGLGLFFIWLFLTGATGGSSSTAIAIAGVVGVLLPFGLKLVPAAGHYMVVITLVASFAVAVVAELVSGELALTNLQHADGQSILALFLSVYALSQVVYAALTQSPKTVGTVT